MRNSRRTRSGKSTVTHVPAKIPYGQERGNWFPKTDDGTCHDCGVGLGEYHPLACVASQCCICGGQTLTCCGCGAYGSDKEFWKVAQVDLMEYVEARKQKKRALAETTQISNDEVRRN